MKIFITGGSGLLGQYLNLILSGENEILTQYLTKPGNCIFYSSCMVNITDYKKIKTILVDFKPDIIIHSAAISSPQICEILPSKIVYDVNVTASQKLAELASSIKAKLVYISTDLVYAGYRGSMLKEDGKLNPMSLYAESKLMGEEKIKETSDNYIILRTSLLYGFGLSGTLNHFHSMYNYLKEGKRVQLFYDQYRSPLSLWEAARTISVIIRLNLKNEIFNFGGRERVSRLELGERLCRIAGLDDSLIEKISMDDIPIIPEVADVSMNTDKLQSLGISLKSINESINEIIEKQYIIKE
jgi:dTDP-4-dehydrorhamnose reductase